MGPLKCTYLSTLDSFGQTCRPATSGFAVVAIIPATVIPAVHDLVVHVKQWTSTKVRSRATEIPLETPQRGQSRKQTHVCMTTST